VAADILSKGANILKEARLADILNKGANILNTARSADILNKGANILHEARSADILNKGANTLNEVRSANILNGVDILNKSALAPRNQHRGSMHSKQAEQENTQINLDMRGRGGMVEGNWTEAPQLMFVDPHYPVIEETTGWK